MARTIEAVRQAIFGALTATTFTYMKNNTGPFTIPSTSIYSTPPYASKAVAPDPIITFTVTEISVQSLSLADRFLRLTLWVTASDGADTCVEIFEQARSLLLGSQDATGGNPVARAATATTLAAAVREVRPDGTFGPEFEKETQRFFIYGRFRIVAV